MASRTSRSMRSESDMVVSAPHTHLDTVIEMAKQCQIPIECDDLKQPVFTRGQTICGYVGEELGRDHTIKTMSW
jgi:hypothetical protein